MKIYLLSRAVALTAIFLAVASASSVRAAIYTPGAGFSTAANPNGPWSYGYSTTLGGALILHATSDSPSGLSRWLTNIGSSAPSATYNSTGSAVTISTYTSGAGEFTLHPGPAEYAILRFTAPIADTYSLSGAFFGQDSFFPTTTDVHLLLNGVSIWDSAVNGFGPSSATPFSTNFTLSAGGTLDFVVGRGPNDYLGDSTGLAATISNVPEPSSALLGLAAMGLMARRRR